MCQLWIAFVLTHFCMHRLEAAVDIEWPFNQHQPTSSLHWTILILFYAIFLQLSILVTKSKRNPFPSPLPPNFPILSAQTIILYALTQCSFVFHTHIYRQSFIYRWHTFLFIYTRFRSVQISFISVQMVFIVV